MEVPNLPRLFVNKMVVDIFDLVGRVFANDPGDLGSIPGRVIPKTQKMVLDTALLNTSEVKHFGVVGIEKEALGSPST